MINTEKKSTKIRIMSNVESSVVDDSLSFIIKKGNISKDQQEMLIDIEFMNMSDKTLKLLDKFEPIGVFLSIDIITQDGSLIKVLKFSKADFSYEMVPNYIEIPSGKSYKKQLNLISILKDNGIVIPVGKNKLVMTYHNQYGKEVIKGWYKSNVIDI